MIETSVILASAATLYLAIATVVAASRKPAYSHATHTISELAESGSTYTLPVSLGVFLPVAVALGIVAWDLRSTHPPVAALALSLAVGYGLGAMFPCDPGSPIAGSGRQTVHNVGGGIQYLGGAMSLMWIGESGGSGFRAAGLVVGISAILLSFESRVRGIIQRIAESCLFIGLLAALGLSTW